MNELKQTIRAAHLIRAAYDELAPATGHSIAVAILTKSGLSREEILAALALTDKAEANRDQ